MPSGNPFLTEKRFLPPADAVAYGGEMTVTGTMNKIGILFAILAIGAGWTWTDLTWADQSAAVGKMIIGLAGGLVFSLVTVFKKEWSAYTAPLYAFCEGMVLGGLSSLLEARYPGIAMQSVLLTFGIFIAMFVLYRFRIIRVTQRLQTGIIAATAGIALFYVTIMILGFFGISAGFLFFGGPVGIIISLVIVGVATFNLLLDFNFIEQTAGNGAPKYMEWFAAFGLMVTLVWLYIEILRLLARSRD
jgi:uncharacterized YccA/Bax inhibitor family protein